ncbi:VOC family protein [Actinosynnema sp. NPDC047251]|uniref:Glyoxalase-like domain-containing protein n=1 Tax=Saccharothrix espanaensis (strain ATCC 51144 / DSM 44229 / JCM 9112 / NBRC 15066 / NRRL 15764) TaxID=1179773 RepID=K0K5W5_SACES|nr:VOC family protein [Saccharothrix espanaensis]CCH32269.1 hypothetical protein BN6_50010 [Saccharothrix espanaensis DSM 44229]
MNELDPVPALRQVVLDATDARALAEFYRRLLGLTYRDGDQPGGAAEDRAEDAAEDGAEDTADWLVLRNPGGAQLAFQRVDRLPEASWPDADPVPQQLHLDMTVASVEELDVQHVRVLKLGGRLLSDRGDDPEEPLRVYADPAGHPFCIFVAA